MATQVEAARHIDLGERRFRELIEADVFKRMPPGQYDLDAVRIAYIRHLREMAAGRGADNDARLSDAKVSLTLEQRDNIAIKNAIARGEVVSVDEVGKQVERDYAVVRERLLAIPGKISDSLVGGEREDIEAHLADEIAEALHELHDPDALTDRARGTGEATSESPAGSEAAAASERS
jgi:phage terminase Nu1 subunit (DNA packaging protein)